MNEEKIVIEIGENGDIKAETFGMEGATCMDELSKLMRNLATVVDVDNKPEFYENKMVTKTKQKVGL